MGLFAMLRVGRGPWPVWLAAAGRSRALVLALVSGLAPLPVLAGTDRYDCDFTLECLDAHPCSTEIVFPVTLQRRDDGWDFIMMDDEVAVFQPVPGAPGDALVLVAAGFDPDGRAVSLLTVNPDGKTFLSTHGAFPRPAVITHHGVCAPEVR